MSFESFPYIIGWELTLACNLRCRHCGSSAALPRANELTLSESLAICDQFPDLLVQEVNFTGGEPLLRPDWPRIVSYLEKIDIKAKILTNGLDVKSDALYQMRDAGIAGVGISLDGIKATHENIRGRINHFDNVIICIEKVLEVGLPLTIITTVNALNVDELPLIFELLRSSGVNKWQVQPIFPLGRAKKLAGLTLSEQEYMKLGSFIKNWWSRSEDADMEMLPGDSFGYFTEFDVRQPPWRGCPAGLVSCGITSDGRIKGCLSLPDDLIEGDLRENDLWDIWFNQDSFPYTRQFSIDKLGPFCQHCDRAEQCKGGCSAMSYGSTGKLNNDPYCFYSISRRNASDVAKG